MPDPFTNEDRARLEYLDSIGNPEFSTGKAVGRALAHIDHLEAALREADELARVAAGEIQGEVIPWVRAYRSARVLSASTKEGEK